MNHSVLKNQSIIIIGRTICIVFAFEQKANVKKRKRTV